MRRGTSVAFPIAVGVAIGGGLFAATGNVVWLALGAAIGAALAAASGRRSP